MDLQGGFHSTGMIPNPGPASMRSEPSWVDIDRKAEHHHHHADRRRRGPAAGSGSLVGRRNHVHGKSQRIILFQKRFRSQVTSPKSYLTRGVAVLGPSIELLLKHEIDHRIAKSKLGDDNQSRNTRHVLCD